MVVLWRSHVAPFTLIFITVLPLPGDLSELSLTFSLSIEAFGTMREVELKPGGKDIPVTNDNVIEYIHR
jgi:hypothetical protein